MTTQCQQTLFHVFLVEDEEDLNRDLLTLIECEIPGCTVISSTCVRDAMAKLANPESPCVDIALLDLMLPDVAGATETLPLHLHEQIRELGIPSILMTGYAGFQNVDEFVKTRRLNDPPLKVISKREMDVFVDAVINTIRDFVVSKTSAAVRKELNDVFSGESGSSHFRSSTAELMTLQHRISNYWYYLSPEARAEVQRRFTISASDDGCTVSLR